MPRSAWARFALLLAVLAAGCSTPDELQEQSHATVELYRQALDAHDAYRRAVALELAERHRARLLARSRAGRLTTDQLAQEAAHLPPEDREVLARVSAERPILAALGIAYDSVDRFLQIDVLDLDDMAGLAKALGEAGQTLDAETLARLGFAPPAEDEEEE